MVVVDIDGLSVVFPYDALYPEQRAYMHKLKEALDAKGKAVLEMPSGTGKTITLLALITAHIATRKDAGSRKLVYCTRTVEEMQKVMQEMKILTAARESEMKQPNNLVTVGLASRKHLCIHERVRREETESVDSACMRLTASWLRRRAQNEIETQGYSSMEMCEYFEKYEEDGEAAILTPGVYDLADLRNVGYRKRWCPYFLARHMVGLANVVVFSYHCTCVRVCVYVCVYVCVHVWAVP